MTNEHNWTQIGGDMDPGAYGATIARNDGDAIELIQIQPVREYVGDDEACEVGHPFWTKVGWYEPADLALCRKDVFDALNYTGCPADAGPVHIAEALLAYGTGADEGASGWAADVLPSPMRVQWFSSKRPNGWRYLASEDVDFRTMVRDCR